MRFFVHNIIFNAGFTKPLQSNLMDKLKKILFIILLPIILTLASCDSPPFGLSRCIESTEFGSKQSTEVTVQADGFYEDKSRAELPDSRFYGKWIDSKIQVSKDQTLNISTVGIINKRLFKSSFRFVSNTDQPQVVTDFMVSSGDLVTVNLGVPCTKDGLTDRINEKTKNGSDCADGQWNKSCNGINGMLSSIYVGNTGPLNDNKRYFSPAQNDFLAAAGVKGAFFSSNTYRGLYFISNVNGYVSFLAYDSTEGAYDDNYGCYNFDITVIKEPIFNGVPTGGTQKGAIEFLISNEDPNTKPELATTLATTLADGTLNAKVNRTGTVWLRVKNDDVPQSLVGSYIVKLETTYVKHTLSKLINRVINPVKQQVLWASAAIYHSIAGNSYFHKITYAMINLYIIFYAIFFMFGLVQISQYDLVIRLIKLGFILNLLNSNLSWEFFTDYLVRTFLEGSEFLLRALTSLDPSPASGELFQFVDLTVGEFFTDHTWIKISSLLLTPIGFILAFIIMYTMYIYIVAIIEAILAYLFSIVSIALLLAVAPLFMISMLFSQTKNLFDNWIRYLVNFALQPVILFASILLINKLAMISFYQAMSFRTCWGCAINFGIYIGKLELKLFCLSYYLPVAANSDTAGTSMTAVLTSGSVMGGIFILVMMFLLFTNLMKQMANFTPRLTGFLIQGTTGNAPLSGDGSAASEVVSDLNPKKAKSLIGIDKDSRTRRKNSAKEGELFKKEYSELKKEKGLSDENDKP